MAVKVAFSRIPANSTCTVYSGFPPIIPWLRGLTRDDVPVQIVYAEIAPIGDMHQREAQQLAKVGCLITMPIEP